MDQRLFAFILAWLWLGVIGGFGFDVSGRIGAGKFSFPLIVHLHALVFVGWMVLFTCQLLLIRHDKLATHKRLGLTMVGYVGLMVVIGLVTTYQVDRLRLMHPGTGDPTFFIVAATDILAFGLLAGVGLSKRRDPAVHKRLMLLAAIYITDAGFARLAPLVVVPLVGNTFLQTLLISYFFNDLAMIAIGVYDWVTRRRLYPAYVAAMVFIGCIEMLSTWMYVASPAIHATVLRFLAN
jgi:hypothetical protein